MGNNNLRFTINTILALNECAIQAPTRTTSQSGNECPPDQETILLPSNSSLEGHCPPQ